MEARVRRGRPRHGGRVGATEAAPSGGRRSSRAMPSPRRDSTAAPSLRGAQAPRTVLSRLQQVAERPRLGAAGPVRRRRLVLRRPPDARLGGGAWTARVRHDHDVRCSSLRGASGRTSTKCRRDNGLVRHPGPAQGEGVKAGVHEVAAESRVPVRRRVSRPVSTSSYASRQAIVARYSELRRRALGASATPRWWRLWAEFLHRFARRDIDHLLELVSEGVTLIDHRPMAGRRARPRRLHELQERRRRRPTFASRSARSLPSASIRSRSWCSRSGAVAPRWEVVVLRRDGPRDGAPERSDFPRRPVRA